MLFIKNSAQASATRQRKRDEFLARVGGAACSSLLSSRTRVFNLKTGQPQVITMRTRASLRWLSPRARSGSKALQFRSS